MHTTQTAVVFSIVFTVLCMALCLCPTVYLRTQEIASLSVTCQEDSNEKSSVFAVIMESSENNDWSVEMSCPEKAYRFGKGVRDSLRILLG
jgi:hypothetical protein